MRASKFTGMQNAVIIREAAAPERGQMRLSGIVEMDGMYIGSHVKPANRKENRVDRRLPQH